MENKYREYRGFWYKYVYDLHMWRISIEKDDSKCSVWMFNCNIYSLDKAISAIWENPDFLCGIEKGYEPTPKTLIAFCKKVLEKNIVNY